MEFQIAIPCKGRAGKVLTAKIIKSGIIYVPESEVSEYNCFYKNVVGIPDSVKGITATRNWILKNNNCNIFFIDDDLLYCGYIGRTNEKYKVKRITDEQLIISEIEKLFEICLQMSSKICGFFTVGNNLTNYSYNPYLFNGVCLGSCMGIINDGEYYFNEEFKVKEDYKIS